jgi:hypothetical protein
MRRESMGIEIRDADERLAAIRLKDVGAAHNRKVGPNYVLPKIVQSKNQTAFHAPTKG